MNDNFFMEKALRLSEKAKGLTSPNPWVGAVIVKNNKILGWGYHKGVGFSHAEKVAIEKAKNTKDAILYVTLEPCYHWGRTPPCTDEIIRAGIKKVVFSVKDPHPVGGSDVLRKSGIEVESGILEEKVKESLLPYLVSVSELRPYVILKLAMSIDGKITAPTKYITSEKSRYIVHRLRAISDAVLVGINTVMKDNPYLTARVKDVKKHPIKVVIDPEMKIQSNSNVINSGSNTIVFVSEDLKEIKNRFVSYIRTPYVVKEGRKMLSIEYILKTLKKLGVILLVVEGGAFTSYSFIENDFVDEVMLFFSPKVFGAGKSIEGPRYLEKKLRCVRIKKVGEDILIRGSLKRDIIMKFP